MTGYVRAFGDGSRDMAALLGGKGAGLAEMTRLGLPVPPGFTVTTDACRVWLKTGEEPPGLSAETALAMARLERAMGRRSAPPTTRCWCPCAPAPPSRCPA
ncbi:hypothetical protein GCM10020256_02620 [Streptomyces thermocoprophilus]